MRSSLCVSILLLSSIALAQSNKPTRPVTYSVHFKSVNFDRIQVEGAIDAQMSQLGLSKDDQRPDLRLPINRLLAEIRKAPAAAWAASPIFFPSTAVLG